MKKASVFISTILSLVLLAGCSSIQKQSSPSLADTVNEKGEITIGYIIYPPLMMKDSKTGKLSGVSYDIVEAAAKKLNLKTNWSEEVGWGTAIEGLKTRRYDILGTQMWPNEAREKEAVFSAAPMVSVVYPYVKADDTRFDNGLDDLNSDEYTISVLDGEMSIFIAKEDFPKANLYTLPQLSSYGEVFLNITTDKADITFVEPSAANDFLKKNPGKIKKTGLKPLRTLGNSFAIKKGEHEMVSMWNSSIQELIDENTIRRILEDYGVANDYVIQ